MIFDQVKEVRGVPTITFKSEVTTKNVLITGKFKVPENKIKFWLQTGLRLWEYNHTRLTSLNIVKTYTYMNMYNISLMLMKNFIK